MPEYLTPGVYVEEVERGAKPIEGVSTSTAGFLGEAERGPIEPERVTSFSDFRRIFGGPTEGSNLAYAVDGFFRNGGGRAYIARIVPNEWRETDDAVASATLDGVSEDVIEVTAVGPGSWGTNVAVWIDDATLGRTDQFKVTIGYWRDLPDVTDIEYSNESETDPGLIQQYGEPDHEEVYDNLSTDESKSNFYESRINSASTLVDMTQVNGGRPENGTAILSASHDFTAESVGTDDFQGEDTAGERTGFEAFKEIDEISIVCVPDENAHTGLRDRIIEHCENDMEDRVAVLQPDTGTRPSGVETEAEADDTSYAALYYPWLTVLDPDTNVEQLVPPGGHVAGIYARSDTEHGVHKAPANEVVRGIQSLELNLTKEDQASLNPKGVNCIRSFRGRGIRVWGARTLSSDPSWKYVNVRRLLLFIEESIDEGTQWVVFESNDERTWARVRQTIGNFLTSVWNNGALMGSTPEEAFYVKCDRSTMTQDDIDNGRLICEIGVAPVKPAEFVIFRISQWTGGVEEGA